MTTTSQTIMRLRCDLWNILGNDKALGKALSQYGMLRFNKVIDGIITERAREMQAERATCDNCGAESLVPPDEWTCGVCKEGAMHIEHKQESQ